MATSRSATAVGGGSRNPIYISSDEDGERAPLDDSYGEEDFQIQAALLLSLESSRAATAAASTSSARADVSTAPQTSPSRNRKDKRKISSEDGPRKSKKKKKEKPSRRDDHFDCAICFDRVPVTERFPVSRCAHAFCNTCVGRYVAAKVAENVAAIGCPDPDCMEGAVEIDQCQGIIPSELFDRWSVALCEDAVGGERFYCPFKDCSALLINEGTGDGAAQIRESECPHCHRMFCASCHVPWHPGIKCEDFNKKPGAGDNKGKDDDLTLTKLAKKKKWQRCPKCNMYVERIDGCVYIVCRCQHRFCYLCASPMTKGDHRCSKCKRTW